MFLIVLLLVGLSLTESKTIYDFSVEDINGEVVDFGKYRGRALLIVNVASQCGQTDAHYKSLKRLHDILSFQDKFSVLAFPCNDYGDQEPWDPKEIEEFVKNHFKADFPLFKKVKIVGDDAEPIWKHIIEKSTISPTWNFQKYLFNNKGHFVKSWDSNTPVESIFDEVKAAIESQNDTVDKSKSEL